jgi:hypothetical protein
VLGTPPPPGAFDLPGIEVVASTGQDVHLIVRGDPQGLLRRIADLDVRDVAIATPDIEDVFLTFYEGVQGQNAEGQSADGQRADGQSAAERGETPA